MKSQGSWAPLPPPLEIHIYSFMPKYFVQVHTLCYLENHTNGFLLKLSFNRNGKIFHPTLNKPRDNIAHGCKPTLPRRLLHYVQTREKKQKTKQKTMYKKKGNLKTMEWIH